MSEVKIPFKPRFKEPMLNGQKTWTSRTRRMGNIGDTFDAFGATFEIVEVSTMTLKQIADNYFREEGCRSVQDFVEVWRAIHPRKGSVPSQRVYVHVFRRISI